MKILIGLSGGVDSAYAALKLKREGHEVEGAVLRMHEFTDVSAACEVAELLEIPIHIIDCTEAFDKKVKEYFCDEYSLGRTPNPCIVCNREVKFKELADYARAHGFDRIATGHYARVKTLGDGDGVRYAVARGADLSKDQTYMLYRLPQNVLSMLILPMAELTKTEIRKEMSLYSRMLGEKKDSQEICFIPDDDYASFVEAERGAFPDGDFVDGEGNPLGRHRGIIRYTVGQRKGLGISLGYRAFVSRIDSERNRVVLSREGTPTDTLEIRDVIFSGMRTMTVGDAAHLDVKLRYQAVPIGATVEMVGESRVRIKLDSPVSFVTPGQSAVLYDGDTVMLGGFIS